MHNGPTITSPEDAAKQIRQLLSSYIHTHQALTNSAWLTQANDGLIAFNAAFPEAGSEGNKLLNLDELKEHVLNNIAPTFVVFIKWIFLQHGSSTLRTDLENAANNWPTQQAYLVHSLAKVQQELQHEKARQVVPDLDVHKTNTSSADVEALQVQLLNLRTVNERLVERLKEKEAANVASVPADHKKQQGKKH